MADLKFENGSPVDIEAMDRMSVNEKIEHFARKDAFRLPRKPGENWGAPRRLKRKNLPPNLGPGKLDAPSGNVTRQAYVVVGRPCHGIPTARLVHGRVHMIRKTGRLALTRCGECPLKASCDFIVWERLIANERIREAHRDFQRRGGAEALWAREPSRRKSAASGLRTLVRELQAASFTTVNDKAVAAHYDERARVRREGDAYRQRAHRKLMAEQKQEIREAERNDFLAEAKALKDAIEFAQASPECPRWLSSLSASDAARVWVTKAYLIWKGEKHGATHIAHNLAKKYKGVSHDALRLRVSRILKRMPLLEALPIGDQNKPSVEVPPIT